MKGKQYSSKKRQAAVRSWQQSVQNNVALACGWWVLGDEEKRQRDLLAAAAAARSLADELERAAAETPRPQWTMSVRGNR
jgi:hypothetical protein